MKTHESGTLVISLDCELYWGVRDKHSLEDYKERLLGDRAAVYRLTETFTRYNIHATWAFVGFLFFGSKTELLNSIPSIKPEYSKTNLNPYLALEAVGENEAADPYHYGKSLINFILKFPHQELASHTFSHLYSLEEGVSPQMIAADLMAAKKVAQMFNVDLKSLVFPRNQYDQKAVETALACGFVTFRGNPQNWLYRARNGDDEILLRRALRLIDSYLPLSGCQGYKPTETTFPTAPAIANVRASRFLRPYSRRLRLLEPLKLRRIMSEMTEAAKNKKIYHLWWHPHNFGTHTEENFKNLEVILDHYRSLNHKYGFQSKTMSEVQK